MRHLLILAFQTVLFSLQSYAQTDTNAEDIFHLQVYLDRKNVVANTTIGYAKDHSRYLEFKSSVHLDIDSLRITSAPSGMEDFVTFLYSDLKNVEYNFSEFDQQDQLLSLFHGPNTEMVLALNRKTGQAYRISGFNGNDMVDFLNDFIKHYEKLYGRKLNTRNFFSSFKVDGIDLRCIYGAARRVPNFGDRSPCLKSTSEPFKIG